ncbi:helix-turn-helix domain-containing protein [Vagococcus zengguangii]|uniref:helix-turn-helix domain-containing protein n=1 Tax=Vagococcus zengguangii TaxID=2571750 RepID=UPI00148519B4|nr:helix-turn-helix domain-containing protein [Vagococcus zengguangii]
MAKKLVIEKDLLRQINLFELLVQHEELSGKELAKMINASERTVFSDIQSLRFMLPNGWAIDSGQRTGFKVITDYSMPLNDVWEHFFEMSIGTQLMKELLYSNEVNVQMFLQKVGISKETLKRHVQRLNRALKEFKLKLHISSRIIQITSSELSIRLFFHRLLLPFTTNNFFFDDYVIHASNYQRFLARLERQGLGIKNEETFGLCWFFINTIRIKANCPIVITIPNEHDELRNTYQINLHQLYQSEGVTLDTTESFFAFFCYLESWNYYNSFNPTVKNILKKNYGEIFDHSVALTKKISHSLQIPALNDTDLSRNIALLFLKYYESAELFQQFLSEYPELLNMELNHSETLKDLLRETFSREAPYSEWNLSEHIVDNLILLINEALSTIKLKKKNAYFIFQSEPSWKIFVYRELSNLFDAHINLIETNLSELASLNLDSDDIIIANHPINHTQVIYLSLIPTPSELQTIKETVQPSILEKGKEVAH